MNDGSYGTIEYGGPTSLYGWTARAIGSVIFADNDTAFFSASSKASFYAPESHVTIYETVRT